MITILNEERPETEDPCLTDCVSRQAGKTEERMGEWENGRMGEWEYMKRK